MKADQVGTHFAARQSSLAMAVSSERIVAFERAMVMHAEGTRDSFEFVHGHLVAIEEDLFRRIFIGFQRSANLLGCVVRQLVEKPQMAREIRIVTILSAQVHLMDLFGQAKCTFDSKWTKTGQILNGSTRALHKREHRPKSGRHILRLANYRFVRNEEPTVGW